MLTDNLKSNRTSPRVVKMASLREIDDYYDFYHDLGAIVLFAITVILIVTSISATALDMKLFRCKKASRSITFDLQKYNNTDINRFLDRKNNESIDNICNDVSAASNFNNVSLVAMKDVDLNPAPPVTLDVVNAERASGSCNRCGKYR